MAQNPNIPALFTGQDVPKISRVGSGRVGSGRVGSGRVGSGRVGAGQEVSKSRGEGQVGSSALQNLTGRVGS